MALSLGRNNDKTSTEADKVEQRLRNRLADLENRLEDQQKVRQLEDHIEHLRRKHEIELEKARLSAGQQVEDVKRQANEVVSKARKRAKAERQRYNRLVEDLGKLAEAFEAIDEHKGQLKDAGLDTQLAAGGPDVDPRDEPREFIRQLFAHHRDVGDRLARVLDALDDGELSSPTSDVAILEDRTQELLTNPEVRSKALTVAEKARMFAEDPGKSQYYRELVAPYARAIEEVLEAEQHANVVHGARQALNIVEEAFMDSRTYLLRRSGKLDDHSIEVDVVTERLEESSEDAVERLDASLNGARALGPVDFFQNMAGELHRRIERGEDGAGVAAWILADVTVTILEDEVVRGWLESQH